jgi:hypothetical protein
MACCTVEAPVETLPGGSGNAVETAKWRQIMYLSVGVGALANSR